MILRPVGKACVHTCSISPDTHQTGRCIALGILERPGHDADMEREREWSSEPEPKTLPWAAVTTATFSCGVEIMPNANQAKVGSGNIGLRCGGWTTWDLVSWDATSIQRSRSQPLKFIPMILY